MCLEFVYQKDSELDDDKKFKIFISEKKQKTKKTMLRRENLLVVKNMYCLDST